MLTKQGATAYGKSGNHYYGFVMAPTHPHLQHGTPASVHDHLLLNHPLLQTGQGDADVAQQVTLHTAHSGTHAYGLLAAPPHAGLTCHPVSLASHLHPIAIPQAWLKASFMGCA